MPPNLGWIALTFDDGPVPATLDILDILDIFDVKVTFFISAWRLAANADVAAEIAERGHSVQSHGYLHDRWPDMVDSAVRSDLERASILISEATGLVPSCVRPPYGATSRRTTTIAESLGLEVVIWDENSADYAHLSSSELVRGAAQWRPDSVVLAHDTLHYLWVPVLGEVIEIVRARGLEFVTICDF